MTKKQKIKLTVVDQSPVRKGGTSSDALRESVELATCVEKIGYSRYWVAEHHNSSSFSGTSPEILIGQIAAKTKHIRVGSGGVMLSHYSALKVAEQFSVLDSFYPDRVDLGIGRAPGSDRRTAAALTYPRPTMDVYHDFPQMVRDLADFLNGGIKDGNPLSGIVAHPGSQNNSSPRIWLLGSSDYSAKLAAEMGLPFSFADFFGISPTTIARTPAYEKTIATIFHLCNLSDGTIKCAKMAAQIGKVALRAVACPALVKY